MRRTNIYLDDDQLRALKHLAVEEQQSLAVLVRRAVDEFLAQRFKDRADCGRAVRRARTANPEPHPPQDVTPEQIEADIRTAREEVRQAHRAARATSGARGR